MPTPPDTNLAVAWTRALADPAVVAELDRIYSTVNAAIDARHPICTASSRCCHFEAYGHRLYATGLETARTLAQLSSLGAPPAAPSRSSAQAHTLPVLASHSSGPSPTDRWTSGPLTAAHLDAALARGGCPFQHATLCAIHPIRPLGCRVYFCDPTAQDWQRDLYESALAQLRALHDRRAIPYRYGEWRAMLRLFLDHGRALAPATG